MIDILPRVVDEQGFDAFAEDKEAVAAVLPALARVAGLRGPWQRPKRGSALVLVGEKDVVKLLPPHDRAHIATEIACLSALDGRLPIPTPRLLAQGEWEGWGWLRMSRLPGEELTEAWPELGRMEQMSLATQLGETLAALHGLAPPPGLETVDWSVWREERLASLEETQQKRGCPPDLLEGLASFVGAVDTSASRMGWLHTEVMREHLLFERGPAGVRLSGLFDFEPSWVGPIHYEYASVGVFFSAGDGILLGEVLRAAGETVSADRLFGMAMLHRYGNLGWYAERLGVPEGSSHADLAEHWFGR